MDKLIHLHFFIGGCDWYICEYDGDDLFWGYAYLNDPQNAEWGYISFPELKEPASMALRSTVKSSIHLRELEK